MPNFSAHVSVIHWILTLGRVFENSCCSSKAYSWTLIGRIVKAFLEFGIHTFLRNQINYIQVGNPDRARTTTKYFCKLQLENPYFITFFLFSSLRFFFPIFFFVFSFLLFFFFFFFYFSPTHTTARHGWQGIRDLGLHF